MVKDPIMLSIRLTMTLRFSILFAMPYQSVSKTFVVFAIVSYEQVSYLAEA